MRYTPCKKPDDGPAQTWTLGGGGGPETAPPPGLRMELVPWIIIMQVEVRGRRLPNLGRPAGAMVLQREGDSYIYRTPMATLIFKRTSCPEYFRPCLDSTDCAFIIG